MAPNTRRRASSASYRYIQHACRLNAYVHMLDACATRLMLQPFMHLRMPTPRRFLQLCNDDERQIDDRVDQLKGSNWRVVNVTTPANFFHVLRLQVARPFRKPLVVMSPKQLLRHKRIRSPVADFLPGTRFKRVLIDEPTSGDASTAQKLIMCSGRIWLDLIARREAGGDAASRTALVRLEQVATFPRPCLSCLPSLGHACLATQHLSPALPSHLFRTGRLL